MASGNTTAAIKAALGNQMDEAAKLARRWTFEIGELADRTHGMRRAVATIDADELSEPLDAAYRQLQQAYLVMFLAWRRLDR